MPTWNRSNRPNRRLYLTESTRHVSNRVPAHETPGGGPAAARQRVRSRRTRDTVEVAIQAQIDFSRLEKAQPTITTWATLHHRKERSANEPARRRGDTRPHSPP